MPAPCPWVTAARFAQLPRASPLSTSTNVPGMAPAYSAKKSPNSRRPVSRTDFKHCVLPVGCVCSDAWPQKTPRSTFLPRVAPNALEDDSKVQHADDVQVLRVLLITYVARGQVSKAQGINETKGESGRE